MNEQSGIQNPKPGTESHSPTESGPAGQASDSAPAPGDRLSAIGDRLLAISDRLLAIGDPAAYIPKTLAKVLHERGRLPIAECLQLSASLAAALDHLHKNSLIHRDIKPSNIIFVNGVPKLADIGLVASLTDARTFVGTEGFIPPEGPGTAQADIYSLGKVLYEIATGKDRHDYPELPSNLDEIGTRAELIEFMEIVTRACEPDPKNRYQTASELEQDLRALERGSPIKTDARREKGKRPKPDRLYLWLSTLGMALPTAALLFFGWCRYSENDSKKSTGQNTNGAKSLPPIVNELPAAEVLQIAFTGRPPPATAKGAKLQLQFEIFAKRKDEPQFHPVADGDRLRSEVDDYLIAARPLANGYLYIFQVDTSGQKEWLFPQNTSSNSSGANPVVAGQLIRVPSANKGALFLDKTTGVEHIYAVFSATRWPELEEALAKPTTPPPNRSESTLLARRIEEPLGLGVRGVGGIRTNSVAIDVSELFQRVQQGQTYQVNLSAPAMEASGSFLALERWIKHVE